MKSVVQKEGKPQILFYVARAGSIEFQNWRAIAIRTFSYCNLPKILPHPGRKKLQASKLHRSFSLERTWIFQKWSWIVFRPSSYSTSSFPQSQKMLPQRINRIMSGHEWKRSKAVREDTMYLSGGSNKVQQSTWSETMADSFFQERQREGVLQRDTWLNCM